MPMLEGKVDHVIGVDTHRDTLAAAAVTQVGGVLAQTTPAPTRPVTSTYWALLVRSCLVVESGR